MTQLTIDAVSQSSLNLTRNMYDTLYNLSSYKHTDRGFSMFIRKDYITSYLSDVESDCKIDPSYYDRKKDEIELLKKLVSEMKTDILLIDNDRLI